MITAFLVALMFAGLMMIQTSFLPRLALWGFVPNLVLISFLLFHLSPAFRNRYGMFSAVAAGLLLDFVSGRFFGMWVLILLAASFLLEEFLSRYVRTPAIS
ncbi:MAG: rod shape-determining protein MreD [bacterium]|nr:rod shape-determining protein MreD [bacterium]